ncbi:hypothetical protein ABIE54_001022 [Chitinophagaceae bacterium OAS944]
MKIKSNRSELKRVYEFLLNNYATATEVSVALNIYRPNLCRYKRKLQKMGYLSEIGIVVCPITKRYAALLTSII